MTSSFQSLERRLLLAFTSDDFNATALDTSRWTFVNPKGDVALVVNGTNAVISVPAGSSHEPAALNQAPRLMQAAANEDFELEVKFESRPLGRYAMQGVLVEASANNYLRFEIISDGLSLYAFAASYNSGAAATRYNQPVAEGAGPIYFLRIRRQGDRWTQSYSFNNTTWHNAADFTHALAVTQVGVFAGNAGGSSAPAFSVSADYVFNTASRITPEDANASIDTTAPIIEFVKAHPGSNQVQVTWTTNEPASSIVDYGLTNQYELGSVTSAALVTNHSVQLNLDAYKNYHFRARSTNGGGVTGTSRDQMLRSGGVLQAGPDIDVWSGSNQTFGQHGTPQRWVNLIGRLFDPDGLAFASYTLNGGSPVELGWGPNDTRLPNAGDFNIELPITHLASGVNTVVITARDSQNNISTRTTTINYNGANTWSLPYTADWSTASSVGQLAQVVDGVWSIEGDGIRTVEAGYDRLIAIGDVQWRDFEITVPVTIHEMSSGAGVGLVTRWSGHFGNAWRKSPSVQWWPLGGLGVYSTPSRLRIIGNNNQLIAKNLSRTLELETRYLFKMRVETVAGQTSRYSMKVWPDGTPEPAAWDRVGSGIPGELATGSALLVAHKADVTFGRVTITGLEDTSPPAISSVSAQPAPSGAQISWATNEPATGLLEYGLTTSYELGSVATARGTSHAATLSNLQPGTTYHYRIRATDDAANTVTSGDFTFTTTQADTTAPVIQNVQSQPGSNQIVITWSTNEPATGVVQYGLTNSYELGSVSQPALGTNHSISLSGLQSGTSYHWRIVATDGSQNATTSGDFLTTTGTGVFRSDDFSAAALDTSLWTFVNPLGDGNVTVNGTNALISVPAGRNHDAWTSNDTARLMQPAADEDFELEVKFESEPKKKYSIQGLIIEASPGNYLRFDFHHNGAGLRLFAASMVDNVPTTRRSVAITAAPVMYMRLRRLGNRWMQSYSYDGTSWLAGADFTHALAVTKVGVFAGNSGGSSSPAYTASVDYFFNTAQPIDPEDNAPAPTPVNIPVNNPALFFSAQNWRASGATSMQAVNTGAYLKTRFTGTSAALLVDVSGLTMSAGDFPTIRYRVDGGAWVRRQLNSADSSVMLASGLSSGTHDLEVWFVATQDGGARWTNPTNLLRVTGLSLDSGASVLSPLLRPKRALVFGDSITEGRFLLSSNGTAGSDASQTFAINLAVADRLNAEISIVGWNAQGWGKAGNGGVPRFHDPANTASQTWRYLYAGQPRDFGVAPDYVLVNLGTNDTRTGVAGATVQAAVADFLAQIRLALPGTPVYIIVPFAGYDRTHITAGYNQYRTANPGDANAFLIDIGSSGNAQVTASGNMTDTLHPNASGHAVAADLVWAAMNPQADTTPPIVQNVQSQPATSQIAVTWQTNEPATGVVEYGVTPQFELGSVAQPAPGTSHAVTLSGLQSGQTYYFRIIATDAAGNTTTTGTFSATTSSPSSGTITSDDFSAATLNTALWTFVNPVGDGSYTLDGANLLLSIPAGASHDAWTTNLSSRVMQPAPNEDFELEVKYDSRPTQRYSEQGLLVEAAPGIYLRFDFHSDGKNLRVFAAIINNGAAATKLNRIISAPAGASLYMQVRRQGDVFTQLYSSDGSNWIAGASFACILNVTQVGVFVGSALASGGAPAFTASVDYFFNNASRIDPEDAPAAAPIQASPSFVDDTQQDDEEETVLKELL